MIHIDRESYRSPNSGMRPLGEISAIVLHTGEGTKKSDLNTLRDNTVPLVKRRSAHYYVDRAGNVYELVDPSRTAWHSGASSYLGLTDWNDFSIGIETEHRSGQNWPSVQRVALFELCQELITKYDIEKRRVVAHRWIAPGRKTDPTDWPDTELKPWIEQLYVPKTYTLPGIVEDVVVGSGFHAFYHRHGGLGFFGYALTPEAPDTDTLGRPCTWMRLERAVFKYVHGEGVHLALMVEAVAKGWVR